MQNRTFLIISVIAAGILLSALPAVYGGSIPNWVRGIADAWVNGQIDDATYVGSIEYLINNGIITVNATVEDDKLREENKRLLKDVEKWKKAYEGWHAAYKKLNATKTNSQDYVPNNDKSNDPNWALYNNVEYRRALLALGGSPGLSGELDNGMQTTSATMTFSNMTPEERQELLNRVNSPGYSTVSIDTEIIACEETSNYVTVKAKVTNTGTGVLNLKYIAYLADVNEKMITFENGRIYDLPPGGTEWIEDHLRYAGPWTYCGIQ